VTTPGFLHLISGDGQRWQTATWNLLLAAGVGRLTVLSTSATPINSVAMDQTANLLINIRSPVGSFLTVVFIFGVSVFAVCFAILPLFLTFDKVFVTFRITVLNLFRAFGNRAFHTSTYKP